MIFLISAITYSELYLAMRTCWVCIEQMVKKIFQIFIDVDECVVGSDNCDENANCTNMNGSYNCTCKQGYHGSGFQCTGKSGIP